MKENTINYESAIHLQDEVVQMIIEKFNENLAKCTRNTIFQIQNFEIIEQGFFLLELINEKNITQSVIYEINRFNSNVEEILGSESFKNIEESAKRIASLRRKL